MKTSLTSRLPLAILLVTIVVLAATGNLFELSAPLIAVQAAAVALSIWARQSFETGRFRVIADPAAGPIITRGPYATIRHPMYAAMLLFIWSGIGSHASSITFVVGVLLTALVIARIVAEEQLLRARFPGYNDYARSTKAIVPFVV